MRIIDYSEDPNTTRGWQLLKRGFNTPRMRAEIMGIYNMPPDLEDKALKDLLRAFRSGGIESGLSGKNFLMHLHEVFDKNAGIKKVDEWTLCCCKDFFTPIVGE